MLDLVGIATPKLQRLGEATGETVNLAVLTGDRAVYVGEAAGYWLWAIVWPVTEWMVVHDDLRLVDLRAPEHRTHVTDVPTGALTPRLTR